MPLLCTKELQQQYDAQQLVIAIVQLGKCSVFLLILCGTILLQCCTDLVRTAHEKIIFPATANETAITIYLFQTFTESCFPQVVGLLDYFQVEFFSPNCDTKADYFSRKQMRKSKYCQCFIIVLYENLIKSKENFSVLK